MFIAIIAFICLVVVVWVVWPLVYTKKDVSPDLQSVNSKLLETQIAELEADLQQGVIEKEQYEAAKLDLQRTFLETATESDIQPSLHAKSDPFLIALLILILPMSAYFIYKQVGTDPELIQYMADQPKGGVSSHGPGNDINAMLVAVRAKANNDPKDIESWQMLAQILHIMKDIDGAEKAYAHLIKQGVNDADVFANYADVLASKAGGISVDAPAFEWVQKALDINPTHQQALWIAGTAAYYSRDYDLAESYWNRLLAVLEPGSDAYRVISKNLEEVKREKASVQ